MNEDSVLEIYIDDLCAFVCTYYLSSVACYEYMEETHRQRKNIDH